MTASGTVPERMKAVVVRQHGGLECLEFTDHPVPRLAGGDVLVRVKATAANHVDIRVRQGTLPNIRVPLPIVLGVDAAGTIEAISPDVAGWSVGDHVSVFPLNLRNRWVMGEMCDGAMAEFVRVSAEQLIRLPEGVGFVDAAALATAYGTAYRLLFTRGKIAKGDRVLIIGGSGGVGSAAIRLCKLVDGVTVIASTSTPAKASALRELGADLVVNDASMYDEIRTHFGKRFVNVCVNNTGGPTWNESLRLLEDGGRLLTCGASNGHDADTDIRFVFSHELQIIGSTYWTKADQTEILRMASLSQIKAVVDETLPLKDVRRAHERLEKRNVLGRLVLQP